ncbi:hypothetical protein RO3G_10521 [Rhizopus delemar RA 99-880]|uniref:Uncharacterized protein n=1 Tax=Rhizopus delemar (strain RA 99-880 / ATCC MYA-4621 / FGSC 9543 / NRRL 43880) TaxID=246409 RepID=I1CBI1_RHIO9|nr:hypothetical protein RO3G_10521 [Rhizopus delemar RA 99-880]|eukprot:EIE85811.1 hypothetical protein RO3G_10521 [Rhizopus delemar RA 99-880]
MVFLGREYSLNQLVEKSCGSTRHQDIQILEKDEEEHYTNVQKQRGVHQKHLGQRPDHLAS